MAARSSLRVSTAILCEDIRQERSNKFILIGVFPHEIYVSEMPAMLTLAIYVEATSKRKEGDVFLRISGPGEGSAVLRVKYRRPGPEGVDGGLTVATPRIEVMMDKDGIFKAEISTDNESWSTLFEKRVTLRDDLSTTLPNASPPHSEQPPPGAQDL